MPSPLSAAGALAAHAGCLNKQSINRNEASPNLNNQTRRCHRCSHTMDESHLRLIFTLGVMLKMDSSLSACRANTIENQADSTVTDTPKLVKVSKSFQAD